MRDPISAIGSGSAMAGLLLVVAGTESPHPGLFLAGTILIAVGAICLIVRIWKQWLS
jgi:hypothetical protein